MKESVDEKLILIYIITIFDGKSVSKSLQHTVKNVDHHFKDLSKKKNLSIKSLNQRNFFVFFLLCGQPRIAPSTGRQGNTVY